jgi:methyl-accepting chemotaxis protein
VFDITSLWPALTHTNASDAYIVNRDGGILLSRRSLAGKEKTIPKELLGSYKAQFGKSLERVDSGGVKLAGAAIPIESLGWIVIVENSLVGAARSTRSMILVTGALGLVLLCISFYEWYIARRKIFNPLYSLQRSAEKIAKGDYTAWAEVTSGNEFDSVARAMNTMAYNVRLSKEELEQRIEERTKHLLQKTDEAERLSAFMVNRELRMLELKEENEKLRKIFKGEEDDGEDGLEHDENISSQNV